MPSGISERIDLILLIFGVVALASIWAVGVLIDRWLRELLLASIFLFLVAVLILGFGGADATAAIVAVVAWGLAWGAWRHLSRPPRPKLPGKPPMWRNP
ncbi:hypothetical protein [Phyllobacterium sp. SB3]|uniref:hypothetical protein n=1 Tax=Phyllobacterium sp. SB3 TaxID=3156073 RepID=UPI0032AE853F